MYVYIHTYIHTYIYIYIFIHIYVYSSSPIVQETKTQKMVLDAAMLNTQHYKVSIKGKVEQSREWSSALPNTSV